MSFKKGCFHGKNAFNPDLNYFPGIININEA
jgi:hypothetical protein